MTASSQTTMADDTQPQTGKDPWALPLTIAMGVTVFVGKVVPSTVLGEEGFRVIHALFCAACVLVLVRRADLLRNAEHWILCNVAVLYNPIWPYRLYERERWALVNLITTVMLARFLYRTNRPTDQWNAGLKGFLIGVYVASFIAEGVLAGIPDPRVQRVQEVLTLPVTLAIACIGLYFVVGWAIVAILAAGDFLEWLGGSLRKLWLRTSR
jgi:hypothetical protein